MATAIKSLTKLLVAEDVTLDAAHQFIDTDKTAYFASVKNWLLEVYPQQGGIVKPLLQHMLSRLGKYCNNREEGGLAKKAPPFSKQDLKPIVRLLYTSDYAETCYVDATLVVMMCYLYGRSSDAERLEKQQLPILFGKNLQTAFLQGISLFKDPTNFLTCPVFALAAALLMQAAPRKRLFPPFINNKRGAVCVEDVAELSLIELLETDEENNPLQAEKNTPVKSRCPGAQAYVNRLLSTVKDTARIKQVKLTPGLTSHSFRRGAAMYTNDGSLTENWIIERVTSLRHTYMLGTTQADQKVARVLSGWNSKDGTRHPSLRALEEPNLSRALKQQTLLFANTLGFANPAINLDEELNEVFTSTW
ncbi:Hypothetical protein PHPALM_20456 [Phytophthora palmivora]|uniref:Uncharacterized protein n=1 Tax=Phytophthora palmivora TaxID=4796 RepID=A0A2P4XEU4_9STRA|nr:Hypothetical protein PHPALM_20456 [Phytophthora palmivora]